MPSLFVRNVPEALYEDLQRRAESQRRSLSAEVITLLERALAEVERTSEFTLATIRQRCTFDPAAVGAPDSTALLRQDRGRRASAASLRRVSCERQPGMIYASQGP